MGKPDMDYSITSNNTGVVRIPAYIQKGKWQITPACETCHHFALFSYLHPSNKVKPENVTLMELNGIGSIMKIPVEAVFLALFYNHSLVAQECCKFYRLVVSQFYSLPSVALFQPFEKVVITVDITVLKSSV